MALSISRINSAAEARRYTSGARTGTRTAADFTVSLGFAPTHIRVCNLSDRIEALHTVVPALGTANAESLLTVAAGTRTYADAGIAVNADGKSFTVTVATASLETDDDDVVWEAWA